MISLKSLPIMVWIRVFKALHCACYLQGFNFCKSFDIVGQFASSSVNDMNELQITAAVTAMTTNYSVACSRLF